MNINHVVWFARIICWNQNRDDKVNASQWDCRLPISSAHYWRTRQFLKAEEFQRNAVILTRKYNKGYRLHVARQFSMLCNSFALSFLRVWDKSMESRAPSH